MKHQAMLPVRFTIIPAAPFAPCLSLEGPSLAAAHSYAIDVLVQETKRPLEEVAGLYIRELTRLQALLTSRRVRERLRGEKAPRILAEASAFNPLPDGELV